MNIHPAGYCAGLRAPIRKSACSAAQDLTLSGEGRGLVLETTTARWCKEQQHSGMTDEQRWLYSISSSFFGKAQSHSIIHHLIKLLRFLHYSPLSQARGGVWRGKVDQFSFTRARSHVQRGSARVTAPWHFEGSQWEPHTHTGNVKPGPCVGRLCFNSQLESDPICITFFTCSRCGRECTRRMHRKAGANTYSHLYIKALQLCLETGNSMQCP